MLWLLNLNKNIGANGKGITAAEKENLLFLEQKTANTFIKHQRRHRRSILSASLLNECCESYCRYEELRENAEKSNWNNVLDTLCDLTVRQHKQCRCSKGYFDKSIACDRKYHHHCSKQFCNCNEDLVLDFWSILSGSVKFDFNKTSSTITQLTVNKVINDNLKGQIIKEMSFTSKKTFTETETFKQTQGSRFQGGFHFITGVPVISEGQIIGHTLTPPKRWHLGATETKTFTREGTFDCHAGIGKYVECKAIVSLATITIPYTMQASNNNFNCLCTTSGIYIKSTVTELMYRTKTFDYNPNLPKPNRTTTKTPTTFTAASPATKPPKTATKIITTVLTTLETSSSSKLNFDEDQNGLRPTVEDNRSLVIALLMVCVFVVVPLLACFVYRHKEQFRNLLFCPLSYQQFDRSSLHSEIESISSNMDFDKSHKSIDFELKKLSLDAYQATHKKKKPKPRKAKSLKRKSKLLKNSPGYGKSNYASTC